jgi:hypothetical protein
MSGEWFEHMAGLPSGGPVTIYEAYSDGHLVDITADADTAEEHSREHGHDVFAETLGVDS